MIYGIILSIGPHEVLKCKQWCCVLTKYKTNCGCPIEIILQDLHIHVREVLFSWILWEPVRIVQRFCKNLVYIFLQGQDPIKYKKMIFTCKSVQVLQDALARFLHNCRSEMTSNLIYMHKIHLLIYCGIYLHTKVCKF